MAWTVPHKCPETDLAVSFHFFGFARVEAGWMKVDERFSGTPEHHRPPLFRITVDVVGNRSAHLAGSIGIEEDKPVIAAGI